MNVDLKFYLRLMLRRLPVMLLLFLVSSLLGVVLALRLPTTYESTARLVVQPQQISENLAASTVQVNPLAEVRLLQERLLTRSGLIEIANDYQVFEDMGSMVPGDVVDGMREATRLQASGGDSGRAGPQPVLVSITFKARTAQIAADVVNEYVTRLTAENVRARIGAASETLDFFEREVDRLGVELELRSARITEFQRENADALPDDQDFRMQRVSLLQERIAAAERERRNLTETRERLVEIFEATGRLPGEARANMTPEQRQLAQLEQELAQALTVYSETAPQVVSLNRQIEALRETVGARGGTEEATSDAETLLNLQLAEIDTRIEALDTQIEEARAETSSLEDAIARTPLNAITLQSLQRDYENIRAQYDSAVQRLSQASMGERIEVTARGQRISLIEAAAVPDSPASPDRPMIAAGGFGIGLALAAGFFVLVELLNRTVRRPAEIVSALGITPLATLPYLESRAERLFRRSRRIAAALVVLIGVPAALWAVDTYYLPLDLLAERFINQIGLG
jgi:polysaccharide chain length determinant protein (PEP-CTERM system associated)